MHIYQGREPSISPQNGPVKCTSGTCAHSCQLGTCNMHMHMYFTYLLRCFTTVYLACHEDYTPPPRASTAGRQDSYSYRFAPRRAIKRALFQRVHLEHTRVSFAHAASPRPACHGALTRTLFLVSHGMWAGGTLLLVALARHNHVSPVTTLPHPPQSTRTSSLSRCSTPS